MSDATEIPSRDVIYGKIHELPQVRAGHVNQATIDRWVNSVLRTDPSRILWHIARAGGIGGSDIGSIMNVPHAYSSPGEVYGQKMLLIPPYRATAAMLRGAVIEDQIRTLFEGPEDGPIESEGDEQRKERLMPLISGTFEAELARRNPGTYYTPRPDLEALFTAPIDPSSGTPEWLVGNTDRIYQIGDAIDIIDFKAPSTETLKKMLKDVSYFEKWDTQVQHYGLRSRYLGFEPRNLSLAVFDYQNYGTTPFYLRESQPDDVMFQRILDAGDGFWHDGVLQGINPDERIAVQVLTPTPIPEEVDIIAKRAAHLDAIRSASEEMAKDLKEQMSGYIREHPENASLPLGDVWKTSESRELDLEFAFTRLIDLGLVNDEHREAFRDDPVPMKSNHKDFEASMKLARKNLATIIADIEKAPAALEGAAIAALLKSALQDFTPMVPGPLNEDMIRETIAHAQQPISAFEAVSYDVRRDMKKAPKLVFEGYREEAKQTLDQYVNEIVPNVAAPAEQGVQAEQAGEVDLPPVSAQSLTEAAQPAAPKRRARNSITEESVSLEI